MAKTEENGHAKVTGNMLKILNALKDGKERTAAELVEKTGIVKGKRLPEMTQAGYIKTLVAEEGQRGQRYVITAAGKKLLQKS